MRKISLRRFDALAGYARLPPIRFLVDELAWFEHDSERVLGLLLRDREDQDFGGMVFGQDRKGRYRWIGATPEYYKTPGYCEEMLHREMKRQAAQPDEEYYQGDEKGTPVDFFAPLAGDNKLSEGFKRLRDDEHYSAARGIIEPMMRWYQDADGNFVEQFQTTGFDSRLWELFLFAAFTEIGYEILRVHAVPDFSCRNPLTEFSIEAVTVNPTQDETGKPLPPPPTKTPEEFEAYISNYMPIRFAGALTTKLSKKYWEKPNVSGKPLLFAVQDFSSPGSMVLTRSAFESYICGYHHTYAHDTAGKLIVKPEKIGTHKWGSKVVPSGFFELPGAENISAVIFSDCGTIAKFNRMGLIAGFGSPRLRLVRVGCAVDHDPNSAKPVSFRHSVNAPGYEEFWAEGADVWHNPNAKYPLDPEQLPFLAHHKLQPDGQVASLTPEWHPLGSWTLQWLDGVEPEPA